MARTRVRRHASRDASKTPIPTIPPIEATAAIARGQGAGKECKISLDDATSNARVTNPTAITPKRRPRIMKEAASGDWTREARTRIRRAEQVIVLCGEYTHLARGVAMEVTIAQEEAKPYFLLEGYKGKTCTKPVTARSTDKIYDWTWPNLGALIGGGR